MNLWPSQRISYFVPWRLCGKKKVRFCLPFELFVAKFLYFPKIHLTENNLSSTIPSEQAGSSLFVENQTSDFRLQTSDTQERPNQKNQTSKCKVQNHNLPLRGEKSKTQPIGLNRAYLHAVGSRDCHCLRHAQGRPPARKGQDGSLAMTLQIRVNPRNPRFNLKKQSQSPAFGRKS